MNKIKLAVIALATSFALVLAPVNAFAAEDYSLKGGVEAARTNEQQKDLFGAGGVFNTIVNVLLFLIGAISVIMIVFAGFKYATSGGDSGKVTEAKNTIMYAVIGIIVALLAYAIIKFVTDRFAGTGSN